VEKVSGFVVSISVSLPKSQVHLVGRLQDGRSFAAAETQWKPSLFIPKTRGREAQDLLDARPELGARLFPTDFLSFEGAPCDRVEGAIPQWASLLAALTAKGIDAYGGDLKLKDLYRIDRGIMGGIELHGPARAGSRVDLVFVDPLLRGVELTAPLRWAAIDLETSREESILAISIACGGGEEIFFLGPQTGVPGCASFTAERELLTAFQERLIALDPDVVTGWSVVDFDFRVLAKRCAELGLPFDLGRSREASKYLAGNAGASPSVILPGRQVVDALRIARAGPERFSDFRLETVARAVLGEGKTVATHGEEKLVELERLYRDDAASFCRYCARDARLVLSILEKTGLGELTVGRAASTGLSLDRAWTSIPAFEQFYAFKLHAASLAPPRASGEVPGRAAGGLIIEPTPGLFEGVLVLDFKSLYPTIIRTFNIDPLSHARSGGDDDLHAPNGARFSRTAGILPGVIAEWFSRREAARERGDPIAVHVYKILMNSFYGVLGAEGCRYASAGLAGAVTSFGQKYLQWTQAWAQKKGFIVLYGDTDSVFIQSGLAGGGKPGELQALGEDLARSLNADLARAVEEEYGLPSHLEIKMEKAYDRFYLPRLRSGSALGDEVKGRAKGYAGRLARDPGQKTRIEIKGMEAIRTDGTEWSRRFQRELLARVLDGKPEAELRDFVEDAAAALRSGAVDADLVYRKILRRAPRDYVKSEPPHVRAARLLGWTTQRGRIAYVITKNGSEPDGKRTAPLDREHYLHHQLIPIAASVAETLGLEIVGSAPGSGQLEMRL